MSRTTQGGRDAPPQPSRSAFSSRDRRTSAQPLRASWKPELPSRARRPRRGGVRGWVDAYGWRVYALPVLLALTALVVWRTAGEPPTVAATPGSADNVVADPGTSASSEANLPPEATELPATPVDVNIPSAELPQGGPYTQAGAKTWHGVPGAGPKVGTGPKFYTYTIEVEDGIDTSGFGGDEAFARLVEQTMSDPRGWTGGGEISVQRVDPSTPNPSFRISLTTPETSHLPSMCGYAIKYESSCYRLSQKRVMINLARWVRGAMAFEGDIGSYRQYAINHEVGHAFRNGHVGCKEASGLAPVMMQQTFGVANNYVAELNKAVGNADPVKADGLVCRFNPWPNPQAKPAG